jgi:type IV pilus assembly protein PilA
VAFLPKAVGFYETEGSISESKAGGRPQARVSHAVGESKEKLSGAAVRIYVEKGEETLCNYPDIFVHQGKCTEPHQGHEDALNKLERGHGSKRAPMAAMMIRPSGRPVHECGRGSTQVTTGESGAVGAPPASAKSYLGNFRTRSNNDTIKLEAAMRSIIFVLAVTLWCGIPAFGEQAEAAPQTARQALLEMFFNKTPGTFVKHLPAATRAALEKSGALNTLQQYSLMASQLSTQGQNVQTFETGSVLLAGQDPKTSEKFEITVENDALRGDEDDIEVSFHVYKKGETQRTPFMPQITFAMKKEAQVWTLNEVSFTVHLPLADPDFLRAISEKVQSPVQSQSDIHTTLSPRAVVSAQPAPDAMIIAAMRTILTAEVTYATTYPTVGFACTLSGLDGFGGGEPNERQAMLINSGLASGKKYGYVFTVSECEGMPARGFHLTAVPNANVFGRKAFCADQSGVIRSSDEGSAATCWARGAPVQ